jgi:hypothetical protein
LKDKDQKHHVGILCKKIKDPNTQDEGIAKTQCSKANSRLKIHLQRLGVLLLDFHQKKCPTHPLTWKRKVGAKVGFKEQN